MQVTEIYTSIQGESSWAGEPCTFIRLAGCPLRCRFCDTVYSFKAGDTYCFDEILAKVGESHVKLVELTGGEPLAQAETPALIRLLVDQGYTVLIETSGSEPIKDLHPETRIIMDLKCPKSGMESHNLYENLQYLKPIDEVKFVVSDRSDFDWAFGKIKFYQLEERVKVLISPAFGLVDPKELVTWILEKPLRARLNLQIHKFIWSPRQRGV